MSRFLGVMQQGQGFKYMYDLQQFMSNISIDMKALCHYLSKTKANYFFRKGNPDVKDKRPIFCYI